MKQLNNNLPFANLPMVLQRGVVNFKTHQEKLVFLYSSIVALSGLCYNAKGEYRQQRVLPNLYLFIIADFASGKGAINYARKLIARIHDDIIADSSERHQEYLSIKQNKSFFGILEKPAFNVALIPANVTGAKLIEHLAVNESVAPSIMVESEIDTLTIASKAEHGNFSDILRQGFHNETISYSRKLNSEYIEVKCPAISIALAGTANQFAKLINNAEDGLFSRFLTYSFNMKQCWSSVAPAPGTVNLDDLFAELAEIVFAYYQYLKTADLNISLSGGQWKRLDQFGYSNLQRYSELKSYNSAGLIKRHALMVYKICLTLTAIRMAESTCESREVLCSDADFNTAMWLANCSLKNSIDLQASLPAPTLSSRNSSKQLFIKELPPEFLRGEAQKVGQKLALSTRTVDRFLDEASQNGQLRKIAQGKYEKC